MAVQNLLQLLGLDPDIDFAEAASEFLGHIKKYMYLAQENPSDKNAQIEESAMITLYGHFFGYTNDWSGVERAKFAAQANHPDAVPLQEKAKSCLKDLQDNIIAYSLCYMRLHRSMGFISEELGSFRERHFVPKDIRWTPDTGRVLRRFKKEKTMLEASNERLGNGLKILEAAMPDFEALERNVIKLHGKAEAESRMRSLRSSLRTADFAKARKILERMQATKKKSGGDSTEAKAIKSHGGKYINALEQAKDDLLSMEGKVFLTSHEIKTVVDAQVQEIQQKIAFMKKYHAPYMDYKLKSLRHLKDKLLVVGSPESLMTLYIKLIRGLARPLKDIKEVREYEADVLEHVNYLLSGQFQEIANIEARNVGLMAEFRENVEEYEQLEQETSGA